jgi:hypothetical protein
MMAAERICLLWRAENERNGRAARAAGHGAYKQLQAAAAAVSESRYLLRVIEPHFSYNEAAERECDFAMKYQRRFDGGDEMHG